MGHLDIGTRPDRRLRQLPPTSIALDAASRRPASDDPDMATTTIAETVAIREPLLGLLVLAREPLPSGLTARPDSLPDPRPRHLVLPQ